jgi:hypothetical protein
VESIVIVFGLEFPITISGKATISLWIFYRQSPYIDLGEISYKKILEISKIPQQTLDKFRLSVYCFTEIGTRDT